MPNWCENEVTISGTEAEVAAVCAAVAGTMETGEASTPRPSAFSLESILPTPPAMLQGEGWYDWRIEHWGTKWNSTRVQILRDTPKKMSFAFDTAWGPPDKALDVLAQRFPAVQIELRYFEGGMQFQGEITWENGVRTKEWADDYDGPRGG